MNMNKNMRSENFDVWLFAVDLVNFLFFKCSNAHLPSVIDQYPCFVCKSFSETLKTAVLIIKDSVKQDVDEDFSKFRKRNSFIHGTFMRYAKELREKRFTQGFDVEMFLHYSIHMAVLANRIYNDGAKKVQVSAVCCIADDFQGSKMIFCMWDTLNQIAERIVHGTTCLEKASSHSSISSEPTACVDSFASPEVDKKDECTSDTNKSEYSSERKLIKSTITNDDLFHSRDYFKAKYYSCELSSNSNGRTRCRIRDYAFRDHKPMPSLHESLETSLEELSISSPVKLVKGLGYPKSPSEVTDFVLKSGVFNKKTPRRSLERQIFRLSPVSGIKRPENFFSK